jgi:hypothetical protein
MYENTTMKFVENYSKGGRKMRENDGGMNLIKIHYKYICVCYNETLLYKCMLIKIFKMCQKNKNFECLKGSD